MDLGKRRRQEDMDEANPFGMEVVIYPPPAKSSRDSLFCNTMGELPGIIQLAMKCILALKFQVEGRKIPDSVQSDIISLLSAAGAVPSRLVTQSWNGFAVALNILQANIDEIREFTPTIITGYRSIDSSWTVITSVDRVIEAGAKVYTLFPPGKANAHSKLKASLSISAFQPTNNNTTVLITPPSASRGDAPHGAHEASDCGTKVGPILLEDLRSRQASRRRTQEEAPRSDAHSPAVPLSVLSSSSDGEHCSGPRPAVRTHVERPKLILREPGSSPHGDVCTVLRTEQDTSSHSRDKLNPSARPFVPDPGLQLLGLIQQQPASSNTLAQIAEIMMSRQPNNAQHLPNTAPPAAAKGRRRKRRLRQEDASGMHEDMSPVERNIAVSGSPFHREPQMDHVMASMLFQLIDAHQGGLMAAYYVSPIWLFRLSLASYALISNTEALQNQELRECSSFIAHLDNSRAISTINNWTAGSLFHAASLTDKSLAAFSTLSNRRAGLAALSENALFGFKKIGREPSAMELVFPAAPGLLIDGVPTSAVTLSTLRRLLQQVRDTVPYVYGIAPLEVIQRVQTVVHVLTGLQDTSHATVQQVTSFPNMPWEEQYLPGSPYAHDCLLCATLGNAILALNYLPDMHVNHSASANDHMDTSGSRKHQAYEDDSAPDTGNSYADMVDDGHGVFSTSSANSTHQLEALTPDMPDHGYSSPLTPCSMETESASHKRPCLLATPVSGGFVISCNATPQLDCHLIFTGAESNIQNQGVISKDRAIDFFPWNSQWRYQSEDQAQMIRNLLMSYRRSLVTNITQANQQPQTSIQESIETHRLDKIKRVPQRLVMYINRMPMDNFSMLVDAFTKGEYDIDNRLTLENWDTNSVLLPFTPTTVDAQVNLLKNIVLQGFSTRMLPISSPNLFSLALDAKGVSYAEGEKLEVLANYVVQHYLKIPGLIQQIYGNVKDQQSLITSHGWGQKQELGKPTIAKVIILSLTTKLRISMVDATDMESLKFFRVSPITGEGFGDLILLPSFSTRKCAVLSMHKRLEEALGSDVLKNGKRMLGFPKPPDNRYYIRKALGYVCREDVSPGEPMTHWEHNFHYGHGVLDIHKEHELRTPILTIIELPSGSILYGIDFSSTLISTTASQLPLDDTYWLIQPDIEANDLCKTQLNAEDLIQNFQTHTDNDNIHLLGNFAIKHAKQTIEHACSLVRYVPDSKIFAAPKATNSVSYSEFTQLVCARLDFPPSTVRRTPSPDFSAIYIRFFFDTCNLWPLRHDKISSDNKLNEAVHLGHQLSITCRKVPKYDLRDQSPKTVLITFEVARTPSILLECDNMEIEGLNEPSHMDDSPHFEYDVDTPPDYNVQQHGNSRQQYHVPKAGELPHCPRRKPTAASTIALGDDTQGLLKNIQTFEQSSLQSRYTFLRLPQEEARAIVLGFGQYFCREIDALQSARNSQISDNDALHINAIGQKLGKITWIREIAEPWLSHRNILIRRTASYKDALARHESAVTYQRLLYCLTNFRSPTDQRPRSPYGPCLYKGWTYHHDLLQDLCRTIMIPLEYHASGDNGTNIGDALAVKSALEVIYRFFHEHMPSIYT